MFRLSMWKKINGVQTVVNYVIYKWELKNKYDSEISLKHLCLCIFASCLLFFQ